MIITIDGPAGAGKSSVAMALAQKLGYQFLDTGAMYRALTLAAMRASIDWKDASALVELAEKADIEVNNGKTWLNGEEVSSAIRQSEITEQVHYIADDPNIRAILVNLQRQFSEKHHDIVTEGRDQGTIVFPEAQCKIYLTASEEERARRRQGDLLKQGESAPLDQVIDQHNARDKRDHSRPVGGLVQAEDAIEVMTDGMSIEEVVQRIAILAAEKSKNTPAES